MILSKLVALSFGLILVSCGTDNVAKDYLANNEGQAAADATPGDKPKEPNAPEVGESASEPEPVAMGDAEKGKLLLANCAGCHNSSGLAKNVTLNETAIARLNEAFNGTQKGYHVVYAEAFEQPGRADLEAALKAAK